MNTFLFFQVHGNAHDSEGFLILLESLLAFLTQLSQQSGREIIVSLLPGIATLENAHPLFVHFPLVFLFSFFIVELIASWRKNPHYREFANLLLYVGTFSALLTVIAGIIAANSVAHTESVHAIMERHKLFGLVSLGLATFLSIWRGVQKQPFQNEKRSLFLILSALLCILLSLGADLGGLMVYQYGVAVKAVQKNPQLHQHSH